MALDYVNSADINLDDLRTYLGTVQFPANADAIVTEAETDDIPEPMLTALESLPARDFASPDEVIETLRA